MEAVLRERRELSAAVSAQAAVAPIAIPWELLDRVASRTRIRTLARLVDPKAQLEDGAVEVRDVCCCLELAVLSLQP